MYPIIAHTVMITSFVVAMMILVEYFNVLTEGRLRAALRGSRGSQYLIAVTLGAVPGCLGAFVLVTLYLHRSVSRGAVVACMVATSGDEAFVMLGMFPGTATMLTIGLALIGIVAGLATDLLSGTAVGGKGTHPLVLHEENGECRCFDPITILNQWRQPSPARGLLAAGSALFSIALFAGAVGPPGWGWVRFTLLGVALLALFIVSTVPEHFLEDHLWRHVVLEHVPRIFLWMLAAMLAIQFLDRACDVHRVIEENPWLVLLAAGALGLVPESGPHLLFVTLYAQGALPLSVLVASSIVQDGHGMLPLLAHSWREFLRIKAINLLVGLSVGALLLLLGY